MALINMLRKNGYTTEGAKAAIIQCCNAVRRNIANGNGNVAKTMKVMLGAEPCFIQDLFAVGSGKCYA